MDMKRPAKSIDRFKRTLKRYDAKVNRICPFYSSDWMFFECPHAVEVKYRAGKGETPGCLAKSATQCDYVCEAFPSSAIRFYEGSNCSAGRREGPKRVNSSFIKMRIKEKLREKRNG